MIDDDAEEAELFGEAVQRIGTGCEVTAFSDPRDALKALKALKAFDKKPDIVFLDLNLPGVSGKEVLKELRSDPGSSSVPVVIYSTTITKRDIQETSLYHVKAYLQKPDDFVTLCEKLTEHLRPSVV